MFWSSFSIVYSAISINRENPLTRTGNAHKHRDFDGDMHQILVASRDIQLNPVCCPEKTSHITTNISRFKNHAGGSARIGAFSFGKSFLQRRRLLSTESIEVIILFITFNYKIIVQFY
jgi:hypothetical protein